MKKLIFVFILLSTLLASFFLAPKILKTPDLQGQISDKIIQFIGVPAEMGEISWHWFPLPYLLIKDVSLSTENIVADIPKIHILPSWESLLHGKIALGKVKLIRPSLTIKSFKFEASSTPIQLGNLNITITDGTIISPTAEFSHHLITKKNRLSAIDADLTFQKSRFKFDLTGTSKFCEKFASTGRVDFMKKYYRINTRVTDFNFAEIISSFGEKIRPISKKTTFTLFTEGMSQDNFKIAFSGDVPPFKLKGVDWFPIRTNQCKKISLEKYGRDFFITIDQLQLISPALHLNGTISKKAFDGQNAPIWALDLSAQDIDLSQSRNFVLKEWGNNIVAKEVCAIVLGGKANNAQYLFQGTLDDFETIEKMKILVDVANSAILIPEINLPLDTATGKIAIIDGKLTGNNLSATIGTSKGQQGDLLLDLRHGKYAFKLDLNLDVDGKKLHEILDRIVSNKDFHRELGHFTSIAGRASGHLSLGERLNDLQTTVDVDSVAMTGFYDRLPWPFNITSAKIEVTPKKVTWTDAQATLGPQIIQSFSGTLDWQHTPYLNITDFDAYLDSTDILNTGSLYTDTNRYDLRTYVSNNIIDIEGKISIDNLILNGPASRPSEWQYSFASKSAGLAFSSPIFPEKIFSTQFYGQMDNKRIKFQTDIRLLGDDVKISANYSHTYFSRWSGTSKFTGFINNNFMNWLNDQAHIPNSLHLQPPMNLEPITVTTSTSHPDQYKIAGHISPKYSKLDTPYLHINIDHRKNSLQAMIDIISHNKSGTLTFSLKGDHLSHPSQNSSKKRRTQLQLQDYQAKVESSKKYQVSWKGALDVNTVDHFLVKQPFKSGSIEGDFTLKHNNSPSDISFHGKISGKNIIAVKDETTDYPTISQLKVSGRDNSLQVDLAEILMGDNSPFTLSGKITPGKQVVTSDMKLTAEKISSQDIHDILQQISRKARDKTPDAPTGKKLNATIPLAEQINGQLEFAINNFIYDKKKEVSTEKPKNDQAQTQNTLLFSPLQGKITQKGPANREISLSESNLCGVAINGVWLWEEGNESGNVTLTNSESQNFQSTLPCLGVNTSIIEGDFKLKAKLNGYPDNWQNGNIIIQSSAGIIRRMDFLSKIFSLINFTEIFAFEELPNIDKNGLQYNNLSITAKIIDNIVHIEKATLKGKGLNISSQGTINLEKSTCDLTLFIAPFKMVDSMVTSIPLVGKIVGGSKGSILTFPVKVEGKIDNPTITPISPTAIGKATIDFITETLSLPFTLFSPLQADKAIDINKLDQPKAEAPPAQKQQ